MDFKRIGQADFDAVDSALRECPATLCELSFVIQKHYYGASWCMEDGFVIIKNGKDYVQPLGKGDFSHLLPMMEDGFRLTVTDRETIPAIRRMLPRYGLVCRRDESEYIYAVDDIAGLAGKHYRHERESVNRLLAGHRCTVTGLAPGMLPECMELLETWEDEYALMHNGDAHFRRHTAYIRSCLEDMAHLEGIAIFSENRLIGYTFGSDIGHGTFCDHAEVYDRNMTGLSMFLKQSLSARLKGRYRWIDMEDDMGHPGLRTFKMRLHPKEIRPVLRMERMTEVMLKVRGLWLEAFPEDTQEDAEQFLLTVFKEDNMVAEYEEGRLVSMVHMIPFSDSVYIYACATAMDRRGRGIFRKLMMLAVETCRERGFSMVFLIPEPSDLLEKVYSRLGFSGRHPVTFPEDFPFDPGTGDPDRDIACVLILDGSALPEGTPLAPEKR